jgi:hypothetical protein
MYTVISFTPDGTAAGLYTELIDLASIGLLEITRATSIEFHNATQFWEVKQNGAVIFKHRSRAICVAWEQQHFNR